VTHRGRFFSFEGVSLKPQPLQPGGPPVWIGGRTEAALRRAAEQGDGWMSYLVTPERFRLSLESLRGFAEKKGRTLEGCSTSHLHFLLVSDSLSEARRSAVHNLSRTYGQPFDPLVDKFCTLGPPEVCIEGFRRYHEAGVRHFVLRPACSTQEILPQLRRLAREVIPKVKGLGL
jgi:alkanesulfonate monooxygenase SsuD/methylene tetrahydromethanopterin reductase-like flavin-dependent oxidoreductase (luciferase family)